MESDAPDKRVILAFIDYLGKNGHEGLSVDSWPDDEERMDPEIDATAGPFAIEHFSVDTLPGQREARVPFLESIGALERELHGQLPFHLRVTVKWGAINKGQNYQSTKEAVRRWILGSSPTLPFGQHVIEGIPGVPFALHVWKDEQLGPGLFVGRFSIEDETLSMRIRTLAERKASKLAKERWGCYTRILLIENNDIALMNNVILVGAWTKAFPNGNPQSVDEVWYADTSGGQRHPPQFIRVTNTQHVPTNS
jgi:hypothetical protein